MKATISGTSYDVACKGVPIVEERKAGYGRRVTVDLPALELEDRLAEAACAEADLGHDDVVAQLYRDFERVTS